MTTPSGIEAIVCDDITRRQQLGINKYGTTVAENPLQLRDWLNHAYEETLDKAVYLRRAIHEIDAIEALTSQGDLFGVVTHTQVHGQLVQMGWTPPQDLSSEQQRIARIVGKML